jgi:hypothetical protein
LHANGARRSRRGERSIEDELVVDADATVGVDDEEFQPGGDDLVAVRRHHFPKEGDDVAQGASAFHRAEAVTAVAHILVVRAGDPLLQRVVAARFTRTDVVEAIRHPQVGNRAPARLGVGFIPDRDISVGKLLRVGQGSLLLRVPSFHAGKIGDAIDKNNR